MALVTSTAPSASRSGFGSALNGIGAAVVGYWVVVTGATRGADASTLVLALSLATLAVWAARAFLPDGRLRDIAAVLMVIGGSALIAPTEALMITPALVAVSGFTVDPRNPRLWGPALAAGGAVIAVLSGLAAQQPLAFFAGVLGGYALALVVGLNRRQTVLATARELDLRREHERSALLADRATVARDLHDVLAHSLGGLVIQLDAVEALLEAGRTDEAAARVSAARTLAADGLADARRAVATLRDPAAAPDGSADPLAAPDAVEHLLSAHRGLGGTLDVDGLDLVAGLDAAHRRTLAGVLREALSNARRHAPAAPVRVVVAREGAQFLRVVVANPVVGGASAMSEHDEHRGGGLPGMRSRVAELGDGSRLDAGVRGDEFVLTIDLAAS